MKKNIVREKILNGETVVGAFQAYDSTEITEILGYSGFDYVVIDTEHGVLYPGLLENQIRAAECGNLTPIVRVPSFQRQDILKALDRGAAGLLVPMVNTKADAEQIVDFARYTPEGNRGLTFSSRAAHYNVRIDQEEHLKSSNREILLIAQIETQQAIKNLDEILSVQGIDMIFIGPSDLSQSFGVPGKTKDPHVVAAIESIIEKAKKAKKPIGLFCGNIEDSKHWAEKGIQMFLAGSQALIAQACANYVDAFNTNVKK